MEIDMLLNHLLPALPARPKNAWDFVARAMAVNDDRCYLNAIYVIDNVAYATDGRRMHYSSVFGFENGVYGRDKKKISDPAMVMSVDLFKMIIPKCCHWKAVRYDVEVLVNENITRIARMSGLRVNLSHLLDAVAGDSAAMYSISLEDDRKICVENNLGCAVVMGITV